VAENSQIRLIQSGKSTATATGNVFTGLSTGDIINAGMVTFDYKWLKSNNFHFPKLFFGSNPFVHTVEVEKDNCIGFYGCVGNAYYLVAEADPNERWYEMLQVFEAKEPDIGGGIIDWENPDVKNIVSQLEAHPIDEFTITVGGNPPNNPLEKQVVLFYELSNLKQQMDAICYAELERISIDTLGLNMKQYRSWVKRFNTVESEYLLAESYMVTGQFSQAEDILYVMPFKFKELDMGVHQNYWDYFSLTQQYSYKDECPDFYPYLESELVRLSNNNDFVAVKAYSFGEIVIEDWKDLYPRDFEVHPACICAEIPLMSAPPNETEYTDSSENKSSEMLVIEDIVKEKTKPIKDELQVSIFPNPTTGELQVTSNRLIADIQVFDIVGRKLQSETVNLKSETVIDISSLNTGIYFIHITHETHYKVVKKVVRE
jgi:hypothetical protein